MSESEARRFLDRALNNEKMKEEVLSFRDIKELSKYAKSKGYQLSRQDLHQIRALELIRDELFRKMMEIFNANKAKNHSLLRM
jgi:predicted ribosomally synthesized peptide with nif11-like leader